MKETEICITYKYPLREKAQSSNQIYEDQLREDKLLRGLFWEASRIHGFNESNRSNIIFTIT